LNGLLVEFACPEHGLERFTVKIVKRFNIPPNKISPKFRKKPKPELSCIIVGRNVKEIEIRNFFENYLRESGLWERVINLRIV